MPVEKLQEESTGGDSPVQTEQNGKEAKEAPAQPRAGLISRFTAKKKAEDPFRFQGDGVDYKGKLIGIQEVPEARGDKMCQDAMQVAKAMVKTSGQHKQRILLNISLSGIKIKDEKTGSELYQFPVSKISFIARDVTDSRAFGFIYGTPESKHKFYGIKTAQTADNAVLAIRDMFHIVYEVKKKQLEEGKDRANSSLEGPVPDDKTPEAPNESGIADLLCLEAEVAGLEQGMGNQDWATFEASAEAGGFNKSDVFTSSTGSTAYPANDADSSSDPFGGSFNTTVSSNNSAQPTPTVPPTSQPFDAFASLSLGQQNDSPGNSEDPFDTSHVNQVLGSRVTSTPVGPWANGGTPLLSSISAATGSEATFTNGSNSVFDSPEQWNTFDTPAPHNAGALMDSLLDSPAPAEVVAVEEEEENPLAGLKSAAGIDGVLGKLTADLMGGTKKSAVPGLSVVKDTEKTSPFQKKNEKKSMNQLMGSGASAPVLPGGAKKPLDISTLYAQAPPPQMPQSASNPFLSGGFGGGMAMAGNPFATSMPQASMGMNGGGYGQQAPPVNMMAPGGMMGNNPGFAGFSPQQQPQKPSVENLKDPFAGLGQAPSSVSRPRPSPAPVAATGGNDPFNDLFFK